MRAIEGLGFFNIGDAYNSDAAIPMPPSGYLWDSRLCKYTYYTLACLEERGAAGHPLAVERSRRCRSGRARVAASDRSRSSPHARALRGDGRDRRLCRSIPKAAVRAAVRPPAARTALATSAQ